MKTAQDLGLSRPVLYVNGSGKKALLDSTRIAATATGRAVECADDAAPVPWDYPSDEAFALAMRQHEARLERLRAVYEEFLALHNSIAEQ